MAVEEIWETVEQILEELAGKAADAEGRRALNKILEELRNCNAEECIDLLAETGLSGDQIDDLNGLLAMLI